jgi:thioredoxin 1
MKKIWLLILPLMLGIFTAQAGDGKTGAGIQFKETSWAEVAKQAAKEKKLIFMDIYTTWCGPCKALKKNVFPDKAVGDYFNANFVSIAVDAEKGEGVQIAEKYGVPGYPTLLILDKDGKEIGRTIGYVSPEDLLKFAKQYTKKK